MPSAGAVLSGPFAKSADSGDAVQYYVWTSDERPLEQIEAATLSDAVAEAREMASEGATEDACRFGWTDGQRWSVWTKRGNGMLRLAEYGAEHADAEYVERRGAAAERPPQPALPED